MVSHKVVKESESCSVLLDSWRPHGLYSSWDSQARILEWVAFPFSRDLPNPGIKPRSPTMQVDSLPSEPQGIHLHYKGIE